MTEKRLWTIGGALGVVASVFSFLDANLILGLACLGVALAHFLMAYSEERS